MEVTPLIEFVGFGFEGAAAVDGQLGLIERNTVECRIGYGLVRLYFAPTEGISEALWGRALIGGTDLMMGN